VAQKRTKTSIVEKNKSISQREGQEDKAIGISTSSLHKSTACFKHITTATKVTMSPFGRTALSQKATDSTGYNWPRMQNKRYPTAVPSCSNSSVSTITCHEPHGIMSSNKNKNNKAKIALLNPSETVAFETTTRNGTAVVVFNACIPRNVHPGEEFYVANSPIVATVTGTGTCSCSTTAASTIASSCSLSSTMVRVTCPRNCVPGQRVVIVVPKEVAAAHKMEASTCPNQCQDEHGQQSPTIPAGPTKQADQSRRPVPTEIQVHNERQDRNSSDAEDIRDDCEHEMAKFDLQQSFDHRDENTRTDNGTTPAAAAQSQQQQQHFQVTVPSSAVPGQTLTVLAGGKRVRVTCPMDAVPGSTIRF
jgi:hypothetical protein